MTPIDISKIQGLNKPDEHSNSQAEDYIRVFSCGVYPALTPDFSRPEGSNNYMINFIMKGSAWYNTNNEDKQSFTKVSSGGIVIYKPNEPQYLVNIDQHIIRYWIHFRGYGIDDILGKCQLDRQRFYTVTDNNQIQSLFIKILRELQFPSPYSEIKCNGYLLNLLSEIAQQTDAASNLQSNDLNKRLAPAINTMLTQCQKELPVEELAAMCHLSKYHFIRLFKEYAHLMPHAYLTNVRLKYARDMLLNTNMSIGGIAESVGFKDQLYFSKVFKSTFHMTPSDYRNHAQ